ncbi:Seven transmembrane MLO family protein [Perilla frutescens var. hirtella]|uniref:MLO-like protein n=1 Tax=Perilla frutescens var. hirtella TaxID=608512 RepID=A0AAD4P5B4_PERFH|nr:Seven transmembrane MLO family protein [Perilla frutescens var. hirtella]
MLREGRSLEETPTWSVATVTTVMVFVCLFVERSIYRFGKWLENTKRKALSASLDKIKEELMLLGLISLLLGQWARWITQICVNSSLFSSKFFSCSEQDYDEKKIIRMLVVENESEIPPQGISYSPSHVCGEGREPFVSSEGLEQLHRFLFVLGITHVLYSCITVGLAMIKLCFLKQFRSSVRKSDYMALRLGFITNHKLPLTYNFHKYMVRSMEDEFSGIVGISWPLWGYAILCIFINIHGVNIYFWLSFIPVILVMLVGTKLQHVVSLLALEIAEPQGQVQGTQVKPRDDLFWFGKPVILSRLIQFISFQNAFEMATFIWSLWGFKQRSCFMKNHAMIIIRLISGVLVQFWCSYSTVPLNVLVSTMGSRCKKAIIAESVRESLHSWCKRARSKATNSITTRSTCSLESIIDEGDEIITVGSPTLSPSSSACSLTLTLTHMQEQDENTDHDQECHLHTSNDHHFSFTQTPHHNSTPTHTNTLLHLLRNT